jgi:hypothetical protein
MADGRFCAASLAPLTDSARMEHDWVQAVLPGMTGILKIAAVLVGRIKARLICFSYCCGGFQDVSLVYHLCSSVRIQESMADSYRSHVAASQTSRTISLLTHTLVVLSPVGTIYPMFRIPVLSRNRTTGFTTPSFRHTSEG